MKKIYTCCLIFLLSLLLFACVKEASDSTTESSAASVSMETEMPSPIVEPMAEATPSAIVDSSIEPTVEPTPTVTPTSTPTPEPEVGTRDNTSHCPVPSADGTIVYSSSVSTIDASNASEGYIIANYYGSSAKVKFRITGSDGIIYTYDLHGGNEVFPLSSGSGSYDLTIYENVTGDQYSTAQFETISVSLTNTFGPFLYPNQYVAFNSASTSVAKAKELAKIADNDLDVVSAVYNYIITNVSYDYSKATAVQSGYLPDPDTTLALKTGICLDYASLMVAMLRSQRIPARLEVGYVGEAYHAWISTYIQDIGWVNGIIQFDGKNWKLMDPTFAASTPGEDLENFIGDGSSYLTKYIY